MAVALIAVEHNQVPLDNWYQHMAAWHKDSARSACRESVVPHKDFVEVPHKDFVEERCRVSAVPRRGFLTIRRTHVWVEVYLAVDCQKMGLVPDWDHL